MKVQSVSINNYKNYQKNPDFGSVKAIVPKNLQRGDAFLEIFSLVNWVRNNFNVNRGFVDSLVHARDERGIDVFINIKELLELFTLREKIRRANSENRIPAYKDLTKRIIQIYNKPDIALEKPVESLSDLDIMIMHAVNSQFNKLA